MKASGKIGSNGVDVSDNVERHFETDIYIYIYNCKLYKLCVYFICFIHESSWFFNNKKHKMLHRMNSIKVIFFVVLHT